jgi:hypothetical protein
LIKKMMTIIRLLCDHPRFWGFDVSPPGVI